MFLSVQNSLAILVDREFPHLIIPLKQDSPTHPYGTQYSGDIEVKAGSHQVYTEISFDIPSNSARSCNLAFTIATGNPGAPWTLSGDDSGPKIFNISYISPAMNQSRDAWDQDTRPAVQDWVATVQVDYDGSVTINGGRVSCAKGQVAQFLMYPGSTRDFSLTWYEEADPINGIIYEMYT
ncbi:hypothetical protein AOQ84DRAFT_353778 [Glonium stellatum]|uniref:Ubiquitin 3 binding protein But2 C-terminal domain-containing protein n=1 Tax=Glonium stellatum TaxID=574774 RepID=A0A8E2F3K4_9PEZI|nr:hypothetical protein AOQ84DRAFT_353778 [Glonium stellatum]